MVSLLVPNIFRILCAFPYYILDSVPFWASSLSIYISLYIQCPIWGKSSIYILLDIQCPIMCMFHIFLPFIISSVSHYVQVLHFFPFHYIFSVPFWASSLSIYIPLDIQCPILGKFPIYLHSIRSSVSHYVHVPYLFTFHYIFSFPLCASSLTSYVSLYLQCPILGKYPIVLRFIISSVSHYVQVLHIFTFHSIFSVPFCASSLTSYVSLYLQCPIVGKYPIILCFIIYLVSHYVQVPYLFTFHQIFSVPLCASSPFFSISLYLQFPILMCQFPPFDTFHYIFSVPFWASNLQFYVSLYLQCPIMSKYPIILCFIIYLVSHYVQVLHLFTFHYIFSVPFWASTLQLYVSLFLQCPIMCMFPIFLRFIIYLVSHYVQVPYHFVSLYLQCPITCKFPTFVTFHYIFNGLITSKYPIITFNYIFRMSLCASSLSIYISLDIQCPILGKFPIYLHFIIYLVSHLGQVTYLFTFYQIFNVPFCASSLSFYLSLYLQCPIMCKFSIFFHFIISLVSHFGQVPYLFTFHYIQCPILGKFPIFTFSVPLCASSHLFTYLFCAHFIIYLVSHYGQVPYLFTCHYIFSVPFWASYSFTYIFSVPLCASSPYFYISFYIQCPILCKFPNFLCFVISSVSHSGQVPNNFVLHYIFSVPLCASSLSIYISLDLQCLIMFKFSIFFHFIISLVSHFGQVPYLFTFHQIFSVPLCACSLSFYLSLYLQFPIMCKFPNFLCFVISSVSHSGQVPYSFTFHYIFSVPLCASSPYFYISFYIQCPILCKFPNFLCFVISSVSHCGQVPNNFVLHYIFSVPLCASSLSIYISLDLQCPIMCKFSIFFHFIIYLVSHFGQVPYLFTFHQIFSVPLCASSPFFSISLYLQFPILMCQFPPFDTFHYIFSVPFWASNLQFYVSLYLQCPIMSKYPIILCFIIYLVSHYVQVLHLFTFHYIFSVPFWASTLQLYVSLFLQCPIMCMFPIFLRFIIYLVSHYVQVPYHFMFHYIFSVPLRASSLLLLHSIIFLMVSLLASTLSLRLIISFACHYVQVPYLFTFHHIFSVPFCASSLSIYISLYLQCLIMCKFTIFLRFIIYLVSHYVQVPYNFMFHYIFSVPFCASSLTSYVSLYLQCPILGKFPIILCFIIYLVSHYVQVPYLFTFHYFFCVPLCASSPSFYISLYLQCPIMCKFPIFYISLSIFSVPCASSLFLHFIIYLVSHQCKFPNFLCFVISSVSHSGQVPYSFTFHYIFSVPLCASSPYFYISFYIQCPILCKFPNFLCFVISSVSHSGQVPNNFVLSLYIQCPIMCKFSIHFIISMHHMCFPPS